MVVKSCYFYLKIQVLIKTKPDLCLVIFLCISWFERWLMYSVLRVGWIFFFYHGIITKGSPSGSAIRNLLAMCEMQKRGWEDPLEEEIAIHSSILAWKIPRTEKTGRLQSMQLQRVQHDWVTKHRHTHYYKVFE